MSLNAFSLTGKVALVTGGADGIGFGITKALAEAGARVAITGRREFFLKRACSMLGDNVFAFVNDIRNKAGIPILVKDVENQLGPIDILVNNAGIHLKKISADTSDEEFESVLQTNLMSVFTLTRECAKGMTKRNRGSIILIGSMAGIFGIDKVVAYGTSKAALTGLMRNLVTEYSEFNVRINIIAPGWIESNMLFNAVNQDPERKAKIINRIAMNRYGLPEDVGNAAVFFSSDAAKYITGVILPVDGGAVVNF